MGIYTKSLSLKEKLELLSPHNRIIFSLECAKSVLPHYIAWTNSEGKGWGQPTILQQAIDAIQLALETNTIDDQLIQISQELHSIAPDTEIFPDASGSGALDAVCTVFDAINCIINNGSLDYLIKACEDALYAADYLIDLRPQLRIMSEEEQNAFEEIRLNSDEYPLCKEWKRQLTLIDSLISSEQELKP